MQHDRKQEEIPLGLATAHRVLRGAVAIFISPMFKEARTALDYLDNLYNSISKGSAYYIPSSKNEARHFAATTIERDLRLAKPEPGRADLAALYEGGGHGQRRTDSPIKVSGDLGEILDNVPRGCRPHVQERREGVSGQSTDTANARSSTTGGQALARYGQRASTSRRSSKKPSASPTSTRRAVEAPTTSTNRAPEASGNTPGDRDLLPGVLRDLHPLVRVCHHVHVRRLGPAAGALMPR